MGHYEDGSWVCGKRLQRGCFRWPEANSGEVKVTLTAEEFAMLIGGMDVETAKRRQWYRKGFDEVIAPRINPA
jgi:transposase